MSKVEKLFNLIGMKNYVSAVNAYHNFSHIKTGSLLLGLGFGLASYYYYKQIKEFNLKASEYLTHLSSPDVTYLNKYFHLSKDGVQQSFLKIHYRDYEHHFKMRPTKITGYFDHSKEIHVKVPFTKYYRVFTPFYYLDYNDSYTKNNHFSAERDNFAKYAITKGALVVERGLVEDDMIDRRLRENDSSENKIESIYGTMIWTDMNNHNYTIPNDHYRGVFNNVSPYDMAHYWELPNKQDNMKMYFQQVKFDNYESNDGITIRSPQDSVTEILNEEGYKFKNNYVFKSGLAGVLSGFFFLTTGL